MLGAVGGRGPALERDTAPALKARTVREGSLPHAETGAPVRAG